jgi:hypothetical protein
MPLSGRDGNTHWESRLARKTFLLAEIRDILKDKIASHKLPDELCIMEDFPRLSGGVKIKKFGQDGLAEMAEQDRHRKRIHK